MKDRFTIYKSKFFYLLCSLVLYFFCTSISFDDNYRNFYLSLIFSLLIVFCVFAIAHNRLLIISTFILGGASLSCHWIINLDHPDTYVYIILYLSNILFLMTITYSVLYSITKHSIITADSLFGAICGYFLVGFIWSFIYLLIATVNPDAFSKQMITASMHDTAQHFFYFSFTTMTTLGYGDILPISSFARTCAWLEAVAGQIYLAVWISQLVGLQIAQRR